MVIKHVERRVRLSDSHIKKLRAKAKLYSVGDSEMVGLRLKAFEKSRLLNSQNKYVLSGCDHFVIVIKY